MNNNRSSTITPATHESESQELVSLQKRLIQFLRRRVRDSHAADDLAQDVLLKLHLHRHRLPRRVQLAWALRTARNAVIDHFRTRRRGESLEWTPEAAAPLDDQEVDMLRRDLAPCVRSMVEQLPEAYRSAVELADLRQRPQRDVAEQLGISLSGAKSRVQRGRQELLRMIRQCCDIEFGRRGSVLSVAPTVRAGQFCPSISARMRQIRPSEHRAASDTRSS